MLRNLSIFEADTQTHGTCRSSTLDLQDPLKRGRPDDFETRYRGYRSCHQNMGINLAYMVDNQLGMGQSRLISQVISVGSSWRRRWVRLQLTQCIFTPGFFRLLPLVSPDHLQTLGQGHILFLHKFWQGSTLRSGFCVCRFQDIKSPRSVASIDFGCSFWFWFKRSCPGFGIFLQFPKNTQRNNLGGIAWGFYTILAICTT